MTTLSVEHLVKTFPVQGSKSVVSAVNDVSFGVAEGETLGLVGESGSGKTTVGMCVLRLLDLNDGKVLFDEIDLASLSARAMRTQRQHIQMVFQEPFLSLNPRMTVRQTIEEPLRLQKSMDAATLSARVDEVLSLVRLTPDHLRRRPHELTAGEQQRVGIARAIATDPEFVVLDEPTSLLDPSVRAEIVETLREIQRRTSVGYLFISHDLATVRTVSHRVAVMYLGKIVEIAATEALFEGSLHPYTRALLSSVLIADPTLEQEPVRLRGEIPSPIDLPKGCFLASRCPYVQDRCREAHPSLREITPGHEVACYRAEEIAQDTVTVTVPSEDNPEKRLEEASLGEDTSWVS
jgi:oligopeptide transport system ATP-binding protein